MRYSLLIAGTVAWPMLAGMTVIKTDTDDLMPLFRCEALSQDEVQQLISPYRTIRQNGLKDKLPSPTFFGGGEIVSFAIRRDTGAAYLWEYLVKKTASDEVARAMSLSAIPTMSTPLGNAYNTWRDGIAITVTPTAGGIQVVCGHEE